MSLHSPTCQSNTIKEKEEQQISFNTLLTSKTNMKQNEIEKEPSNHSCSNQQDSTYATTLVNVTSTDQSNLTREKTSRNTFFSTINKTQPNTEETLLLKESLLPSNSPTDIKETKESLNMPQIDTESYLDLLINSATSLMSSGKVSLEYLNSITIEEDSAKKKRPKSILSNQFETSFFNKKCENKSCAIIVDKPSNIVQAKILSQKSKSLWLCTKCYNAWKVGQYCYYCNIIYRDFSFNQQYYDNKTWIECDYCKKWTHLECEEKKGKQTNIKKLVKKEEFKYMCPFCLIEKEKANQPKEDVQMLKKKRNGFQYEANDNSHTKDKRKTGNANELSFLKCNNSINLIKDLELIVGFNEK